MFLGSEVAWHQRNCEYKSTILNSIIAMKRDISTHDLGICLYKIPHSVNITSGCVIHFCAGKRIGIFVQTVNMDREVEVAAVMSAVALTSVPDSMRKVGEALIFSSSIITHF